MYRPPLGTLTWDGRFGWWEADVAVPLFGGAMLRISFNVGSEDDAPAPIPPMMLSAAEAMLKLPVSAKDHVTPHVWANYREFCEAVDDDDVPVIDISEDIWSYVQPGSVVVEERDGRVYVCFECNCDWEIEHGLMLLLLDGWRWVKVNAYDGHVTDGHAYAKASLDAWIDNPESILPIRTLAEIMAAPRDV